ncbi:MAG: sulfite exporter TauE/SafE family protein [Oscillospiraceae bacterium]|jgi:uncharacterized membrane protein YfcA|nr:sulfite exporter TauE/SafE family protein [Oscillospiraceae bacterium]
MNLTYILSLLAAAGAGALGAMGMGGGGILVIYLTLALSVPQPEAQGINLLFFLPCAGISLIINSIKKLVNWKMVLPLVLGGLPSVLLGCFAAGRINTLWLGRIFAGLLIIMGLRELFSKSKEPAPAQGEDEEEAKPSILHMLWQAFQRWRHGESQTLEDY